MDIVAILVDTGATAVVEVLETDTVGILKQRICDETCCGVGSEQISLHIPGQLEPLDAGAGSQLQLCYTPLCNGDFVEVHRALRKLSGKLETTFTGHTDAITGLSVTPCGTRLVSASRDSTMREWCTQTGEPLGSPARAPRPLLNVAISPDGFIAYTGCEDGSVAAWCIGEDSQEGRLGCKSVMHHPAWARSLALTSTGSAAYVSSTESNISLKCSFTGQTLGTLSGHTDGVTSIALSPCGRFLYSGSRDKSLRKWLTATGQCVGVMTGHSDWVSCLCVSACGRYVYSGSWDTCVRAWATESLKAVKGFSGHSDWVTGVAAHHESPSVFSCSRDDTIRQWSVGTGACERVLRGHTMGVTTIAIAPRSNQLFSAGGDKVIRSWDLSIEGDRACVTPSGRDAASGSKKKRKRRKGSHKGTLVLEGPGDDSKEAGRSGCAPGCVIC